jgi:hypothetical protein
MWFDLLAFLPRYQISLAISSFGRKLNKVDLVKFNSSYQMVFLDVNEILTVEM